MKDNHNKHRSSTQLITNDAPFQYIEAYKSLRTNLQFASVNRENKKMLVTSSIPGEGKSTVAINMAIAFAGAKSKVLLVDADFRKPVLHKYLRLNNSRQNGITSVLSGVKKLDECIVHFGDMGIDFLSCGPIPPNPAELLGSDKMEEIVTELSTQFDYIIFDTPPASMVTDAAVLSKLMDGVIFVVRHDFTTIESAQMAKKNLENVGAAVIGCVLNNFKRDKSNKSYASYHYKDYEYK